MEVRRLRKIWPVAQKKKLVNPKLQCWIRISGLFGRVPPLRAPRPRYWAAPQTVLCQIHKKWVYSQPLRVLFWAFRSSRQSIDLWDAVKGSQQGNEASFIFHGWRRKLRGLIFVEATAQNEVINRLLFPPWHLILSTGNIGPTRNYCARFLFTWDDGRRWNHIESNVWTRMTHKLFQCQSQEKKEEDFIKCNLLFSLLVCLSCWFVRRFQQCDKSRISSIVYFFIWFTPDEKLRNEKWNINNKMKKRKAIYTLTLLRCHLTLRQCYNHFNCYRYTSCTVFIVVNLQ